MFFATPHHGLDAASWRDFATQVLKMSGPFPGAQPTQKMLDKIRLNSQTLMEITKDFRPLQESLAFVNFTEGSKFGSLGRVVSVPTALHSVPCPWYRSFAKIGNC